MSSSRTATASQRLILGWSPRVALVLGLLVLILATVPWWAASATLFRVGAGLTAALLALSFNLIFGYTGLISFGHAALFALGGYGAGLALRAGMAWPVAIVLGILAGMLAGLVFGAIALRATGIYFAIITLAMGEIVYRVLLQWTAMTGGENGLTGIRPGIWLGVDLNSSFVYYYVMLVLILAASAVLRMLTISRFGRTLRTIKNNPERASYLGIDVKRYQLASFVISAGFAAFAGVLYGPWAGLLVPELARWDASAQPILATLLGGSGNFLGPIIGAAGFEFLNYTTRGLHHLRIVATGVLLLIVLLAVPGGLINLFKGRREATTPEEELTAAGSEEDAEEGR